MDQRRTSIRASPLLPRIARGVPIPNLIGIAAASPVQFPRFSSLVNDLRPTRSPLECSNPGLRTKFQEDFEGKIGEGAHESPGVHMEAPLESPLRASGEWDRAREAISLGVFAILVSPGTSPQGARTARNRWYSAGMQPTTRMAPLLGKTRHSRHF